MQTVPDYTINYMYKSVTKILKNKNKCMVLRPDNCKIILVHTTTSDTASPKNITAMIVLM